MFQALGLAYQHNPSLRAERASVRAIDETVSQALAGWRPTITSSGDYGKNRLSTRPGPTTRTNPRGLSLSFSQPVFRGFRTVKGTREAKANVYAARYNLSNVEQNTLLDAATAFMNVIRDQAIIGLRRKNIAFLREQLRASQARQRAGIGTPTDVSQARARLAGAISNLSLARATLVASRADYRRVIGRPPGSLRRTQSIGKLLPTTLKQALVLGQRYHPLIRSASFTEKASRHAIGVARGDLLPSVSLEGSFERDYQLPGGTTKRRVSSTILGRVDVPLYQSGAEYSRVRQAKQVNAQRKLQIYEASRAVRAEVVSAWESLVAARQVIQSSRAQVEANTLALRGVRQEAKVGSRTTLDVLDAEQELLDSQVTLVGARRDEIVAGYRLLAAVGRLTARKLRLRVKYYDPKIHYRNVKDKWIGLGPPESD
jgi:outer membrane protein